MLIEYRRGVNKDAAGSEGVIEEHTAADASELAPASVLPLKISPRLLKAKTSTA
jgi:hypothetical protein